MFIIILAGVCALCAPMSGRSGVEAQYIDDKERTRLEEAAARENVLAVGITVTPETQLSKLKEALPGLGRVGMLYTEWGREMETMARDAAGKVGVQLIAAPVGKPAEIPVLLKSMNGAVDAFWLMPDPILCEPDVLELILTHANSYRIPVPGFEKLHEEMGP